MTKKVSQREAARLKKRAKELEEQINQLKHNWVGTSIGSWTLSDSSFASVKTATTLGYAVVLFPSYTGAEVTVRAIKI